MRELAPTLPLLIPGIGAQGGDIDATVRAGWRADGPIIVSSSRAILYAGAGDDFAAAARQAALATRAALNAAIAARALSARVRRMPGRQGAPRAERSLPAKFVR